MQRIKSCFGTRYHVLEGVLEDANGVTDEFSVDLPPDADLQGEPLFQLLQLTALEDKRSSDGKDALFLVVCKT